MELVYNEDELRQYMQNAVDVCDSPVLLDRFLDQAVEVDVDAMRWGRCCDRRHHAAYRTAGVHSGARHSLPPYNLPKAIQTKFASR